MVPSVIACVVPSAATMFNVPLSVELSALAWELVLLIESVPMVFAADPFSTIPSKAVPTEIVSPALATVIEPSVVPAAMVIGTGAL